MAETWPSANARRLAEAVREAGGGILRLGEGSVRVMGPYGSVVVDEPGTRDDGGQARLKQIASATGLKLGNSI